MREIWTIGHSTHSSEVFLKMLLSFGIEHLADVRLFPVSSRHPHFNKENLEQALAGNNIGYTHFKDLGGRRKAMKDSPNTAWKNDAFRGYADYMATSNFQNAVTQLEELAKTKRVAYMCAEAVWWSCHRSLISDYLKWKGWTVWHIMSKEKAQEHPFTRPAKIVDGKLSYKEYDLFSG